MGEERDTTKIRAVFDASYSMNGPSVNDRLNSGPNLLTKNFDISTRFSHNSIAILADIKQALLNVEISKEHGDYLRFLWYDDGRSENEAKPIIYRFLRVVFGIKSGPFFLSGTIKHHLQKNVESDQKFITEFIEDFYVDNTTSGCSSVDKRMEFYQKNKTITLAGGFSLGKWVINGPVLQKYFNKNENMDNNF